MSFEGSVLQKVSLVSENLKDLNLAVVCAYLDQISQGNIPCGENVQLMGDDIISLNLEKMNAETFSYVDKFCRNERNQYLINKFKATMLKLQKNLSLE